MSGRDERRVLAELLALLAHDLKNPLAAAMANVGYVESFVRDVGDARASPEDASEVRAAMLDARIACDALHRLVSNLEVIVCDLERPRPAEPAPVGLRSIVDEVVARHLAPAAARRVEIVVEGERPWALCERDALLRAADNALANAIQHAPVGSRVTVRLWARGDSEVVSVLDLGVVVPEALRARALSLEGQAELKGRTDGRYGRGLSLYAASSSARRAGGHLELGEQAGANVISIVLPRHGEGVC
jgi:signal transduction histidine kinase